MAKRTTLKIKKPAVRVPTLPREVAQICFYLHGIENAQVVRYSNMQEAVKQFDKLLEAADHGKPMILTGSSATCAIRLTANITTAFLVSVDANNAMMADTQKRYSQMMAQG